MHFIEKGRENPSAPPMFCMLLRKHLQGAKIVSVVSPDMERMAIITCDTVDEMGVPSKKYLAVELMGKYSNVILYDADGRILDALKRVDGDTSRQAAGSPGAVLPHAATAGQAEFAGNFTGRCRGSQFEPQRKKPAWIAGC